MLKTTPISVSEASYTFFDPIVLHMNPRFELQMAREFGGPVTAACGSTAVFLPGMAGQAQCGSRETVVCPLCALKTGFSREQIDGMNR